MLSTFGVFFKPISMEFGWTRSMTSGAYSLCLALYAFFGFLMGRLSDRYGPRVVVTACGLLSGSGYLLMSEVSTIGELYLFFGIMVGIGVAGNFTPLASTLPKWFVRKRGVMLGIASAGFGMGGTIMPIAATRLIATYGWRTSYLVLGVIVMVVSISSAQFLKPTPQSVGQFPDGENRMPIHIADGKSRGMSLRNAISTRQLWMLAAIWMCHGAWTTAIPVHIVPYVTDLGMSTARAANILSIIGGLHIIGRITMGICADRFGSKQAFVIAIVVVIGSLFLLQVIRRFEMFYIFGAVFGFGNYGLAAVMPVLAADLFGLRSLGAILGVVVFCFGIGALTGATMAGKIYDVTSSYQVAFGILIAVAIVALIQALLLKPSRKVSIERLA